MGGLGTGSEGDEMKGVAAAKTAVGYSKEYVWLGPAEHGSGRMTGTGGEYRSPPSNPEPGARRAVASTVVSKTDKRLLVRATAK
jgi:hypothetical protein